MSEVIVKVHDAARQKHLLNKITGNIALPSLVDLIDRLDLDANPRIAKKGRITDEIQDSLTNESEIFHFMSKGILIAASSVEELERNRFKLTFDDPQLEGILDGGHNTLAAGRQILTEVLTAEIGADETEAVLKQVKGWDSLKAAWVKYGDVLVARKSSITPTLMPIEIVCPGDGDEAHQDFQNKVLVINAARNNNAELSIETRANKLGFYELIRASLDPVLADEVEWKANDGGRIKTRDLIALALVPLSMLPFDSMKLIKSSPNTLFSSKGQCTLIYNKLMEEDGVTEEVKGNIIEIIDPRVKSALALMRDMPRLFDLIYELLPAAYNATGGKFGKMSSVEYAEGEKKYKTRYYRTPVAYSLGEGFVYPLVYALTSLIQVQKGLLSWRTDPDAFIRENLEVILKGYAGMIAGQSFDPAKVGKQPASYDVACDRFSSVHKDQVLKAHGLI